jgi:hypothetical protein
MTSKQGMRVAAVLAVAGIGLGTAIAFAQPGGMGYGPMAGKGESGPMHGPMMARVGGMGYGPMAARGDRGPMMGRMSAMGGKGGMGAMGGMPIDAATPADMQAVRQMVLSHDRIERSVTNLPNGIRTITESADPQIAQAIQGHVASMDGRLADGRVFNRFSDNLPVLFDAKDKLKSEIRMTERGAIVTQTSEDPKVVAALQAHAQEVSNLARDGRAAMMRAAMAARGC